jgi:DNA polymerase III epsilon subunit-like protein
LLGTDKVTAENVDFLFWMHTSKDNEEQLSRLWAISCDMVKHKIPHDRKMVQKLFSDLNKGLQKQIVLSAQKRLVEERFY